LLTLAEKVGWLASLSRIVRKPAQV